MVFTAFQPGALARCRRQGDATRRLVSLTGVAKAGRTTLPGRLLAHLHELPAGGRGRAILGRAEELTAALAAAQRG